MLRSGVWQSESSQCHFDLRYHVSLKNSYKDALHNIVIYFRLRFYKIFEQIMDIMEVRTTSKRKTQNSKNANFAQKMFNPVV